MPSFGAEVAAEAEWLGWEPMAWQRDWWDVALEHEPADVGLGHVFVRDQACCTVSRQQGKSVAALAVASWWARKWPKQRIAWVSQERNLSVAQLAELADRYLERGVPVRFLQSAGKEHIELPNGSRIVVTSATEKAGHGASWDAVIADETWALKYQVLQSIVPAQAARPSSLMLLLSTMGDEDSSVLNDLAERGRAGDPDLTYVEFSAPDGVDAFDPANWPLWMPALTQSKHMTEKKIRSGAAMFAAQPLEFLRAYGNRMTRSAHAVFTTEWIDQAFVGSLPDAPWLTVGIDVSRGPDGVSVAVGWMEDGHAYADVVEYNPGRTTGWVTTTLRQLASRWPVEAVAISYGPAVVLKSELQQAAIDIGIPLRDLNTTDAAGAAMRLFDLVRDGHLHIADMPRVKEAMIEARQKVVGDRWTFRRDVPIDQSPLIAVSLAVDLAWSTAMEPIAAIY